jgi:hypothetical protein
MAKGAVFQNPGGFFEPLQSGVNKLFSGPAGARPDPMDFTGAPYGSMGASSMQDAMRFRTQQGMPQPTLDAAAHKRADDHWLRMKELDAQKKKIFSDLMAYGNKDLSPSAPSHDYVGEEGAEYEPQDMGLTDTYIDILNPSKYANYDELERERDNMFTYTGLV